MNKEKEIVRSNQGRNFGLKSGGPIFPPLPFLPLPSPPPSLSLPPSILPSLPPRIAINIKLVFKVVSECYHESLLCVTALLFSVLSSCVVSAFLVNTETILLLCRQDPEVARYYNWWVISTYSWARNMYESMLCKLYCHYIRLEDYSVKFYRTSGKRCVS